MLPAAGWIPRTGIQHHRADVLECASAELAGEAAVNPPLIWFVVPPVRIVLTRIQHERTEIVVLESAMDAAERPFLVTLEERVFAAPIGMMSTRIRQQRPRVVVLLSAVAAKFTHNLLTLQPAPRAGRRRDGARRRRAFRGDRSCARRGCSQSSCAAGALRSTRDSPQSRSPSRVRIPLR